MGRNCGRECDSCLVIDCQDADGQAVYRSILGDVELLGNDDDRAYEVVGQETA